MNLDLPLDPKRPSFLSFLEYDQPRVTFNAVPRKGKGVYIISFNTYIKNPKNIKFHYKIVLVFQ